VAGHIQDRWYKTEQDPDGKSVRIKTDRHGTGKRYRARYIGPDGTEKSQSFPDGQKRLAEKWLNKTEADMDSGQYVDPKARRTTFRQYAEAWLAGQTTDVSTQDSAERYLRLHTYPYIGSRPLGSFKPEHVRKWLRELEDNGIPGGYAVHIYGTARAVLSAAVDDGYFARNPCSARSVRPPTRDKKRVTPWLPERVADVRTALPRRFQAITDVASGCGLRQGEVFGLAEGAVDFEAETVHVVRQVKLIRGRPVFAPPKGNKERDVPLPSVVARSVLSHMGTYKPVSITLPWRTLDGPLVTHKLIFTGGRGAVLRSKDFNVRYWKRALVTAGVLPKPKKGEDPEAAREHGMHALRHFYASVLLEAGENIKAVSEYLGHADPAMTLRVYAHIMPSSRERTRKAIDAALNVPDLAA
jgi:integrase